MNIYKFLTLALLLAAAPARAASVSGAKITQLTVQVGAGANPSLPVTGSSLTISGPANFGGPVTGAVGAGFAAPVTATEFDTQAVNLSSNAVVIGTGAVSGVLPPLVVNGNSDSGAIAVFQGPSSGLGNLIEVKSSTVVAGGLIGLAFGNGSAGVPSELVGGLFVDVANSRLSLLNITANSGFQINNTGTISFIGTGSGTVVGKALCKNASGQIKSCTSAVGVTGDCTCP